LGRWNKGKALEYLSGDEDLLRELCEIFFRESPRLMGSLREAIEKQDALVVQRVAHSLKGEASYLGAAKTTEVAGKLEDMARHSDLSQAATLFMMLEHELEGLRVSIGRTVEEVR